MSNYYYTIEREGIAEFKDRGSRFIGYAFPILNISDFKKTISEIKKEHSKATHHCFAYRIGFTGDIFRVSDGGEPSGTAGKPILGQIDSKQLSNVLVIVVRYFGGTLLGVPGLISAYKNTASLCLQITPIIHKPVLVTYRVQFNYTQMNSIMNILKHPACVILKQDIQLFCVTSVAIEQGRLQEILGRLKEVVGVEVIKE